LDAQALYFQIGRLIEEMPELSAAGPLSPDVLTWMGRADALIAAGGDFSTKMEARTAATMIGISRQSGFELLKIVLHRALAAAELQAPPGIRGTFIPAGSPFEAFSAMTKVFDTAREGLLIIDPYLDHRVLTEFGEAIPEGIQIRLLAGKSKHVASLVPAVSRWIVQNGAKRPLELRLAEDRLLHDRAIIVDRKTAWTISQSFKDFAARSHAEIVSAADIAAEKIPAYESVWDISERIV
jgi:hypothetical protein